jgi:hypothetical protein
MLTRPALLLRLEALLVLLASFIAFSLIHGGWVMFALLFLAPDLALLGYLLPKGLRQGTALYNTMHSYIGPAILGLLAWQFHSLLSGHLAIIWIAHIAFARLIGYGLKYPQAPKPTHIQSAAMFAGEKPQILHRSTV